MTDAIEPISAPVQMHFTFAEFNPRRAARGVEACRVIVTDGDRTSWLWMSKRDIAKNMMAFGRHPELVRAYEACEGKNP